VRRRRRRELEDLVTFQLGSSTLFARGLKSRPVIGPLSFESMSQSKSRERNDRSSIIMRVWLRDTRRLCQNDMEIRVKKQCL